jgi:seryl-tRNA synthetase
MIDIKKIRENIDAYKQICKNKNKNVDVDLLLKLDDSRKELQKKLDDMKFQQKEFAAKKDFDGAKNLKSEIQILELEYDKVVEEFNKLNLSMPNTSLHA